MQLFENPVPSLILGVIVAAMLGVIYLQIQKRWALVGAIFAVAATIGAVVVERIVVTPREEVRVVLHELEQALAANDLDAVLVLIDPEAAAMLNSARARLPDVKITRAKITTPIAVEVNEYGRPPTAEAVFTGRIEVSGNLGGGMIPLDKAPYIRRFTIQLRKPADRWLMYDYAESDPLGR